MVSRQETARPLLTQGEVMQLPPADELVLISGMAPIRAQKLRHYEDRNFQARLLAPPVLADEVYADRPVARSNDWGSFVRAPDRRLAADIEGEALEEEGGLQQQRHPGLGEEAPAKAVEPALGDPLGIDDEVDPAADARAMSQARGLGVIVGAHAMNEGADRDPLPSF
jgi:type IV secretion system protein VirD4